MKHLHQVAVLGGGVSGCIAACTLADYGYDVTIVEQRESLMDGASRWNDGKIHLGYTFTGTASLATAVLMQRGAASFLPTLEHTIGRAVDHSWFGKPTIYIVDPASLYDAETLWRRAVAVADRLSRSVAEMPGLGRFVPMSGELLERLEIDEAIEATGQRVITGAWRTSEIHVSAREISTALRRAVAVRGIPVVRGRVTRVEPSGRKWRVVLALQDTLEARVVVNCLWENRAMVDASVAPRPPGEPPVSIRFKRCLFGTNTGLEHLSPSTRIIGRFGDIATYANGDAYLSWYPAALAGRSEDGLPPAVLEEDSSALGAATLDGLGIPSDLLDRRGSWTVGGGYIVASGSGDIDDARSLLHTRDRVGVRELLPGFVSVDTGKLTLGPLLASQAAELVHDRIRPRQRTSPSRRTATA